MVGTSSVQRNKAGRVIWGQQPMWVGQQQTDWQSRNQVIIIIGLRGEAQPAFLRKLANVFMIMVVIMGNCQACGGEKTEDQTGDPNRLPPRGRARDA